MRKIKYLALAALLGACLLAAGCVPPKILVDHGYVGANANRSVLYVLQNNMQSVSVGNGKSQQLFNLFVRVCNHDEAGQLSNCNETLVLENVFPQSVY